VVALFAHRLWMEALPSFGLGSHGDEASFPAGSIVLGLDRFPELRGFLSFSCTFRFALGC
jgi:hypothetical protein